MEAFEHVVKVYLEDQGYVVTSNVKFPIRRRTRKVAVEEYQTHGYEVDIVAAKHGSLLLGFVKSYLGSGGVDRQGFRGIAESGRKTDFGRYAVFNEPDIRQGIVQGAERRFGYPPEATQLVLYVGRFKNGHERAVRDHLGRQGAKVVGLAEIVEGILALADSKTYVNDPVVVTLKCLKEIERLDRLNAEESAP